MSELGWGRPRIAHGALGCSRQALPPSCPQMLGRQDHPTAMEVFLRAKPEMESLSLATVYNVLETLAERGLVRKVHLDSGSTRYCANNSKHGHFTCSGCGAVLDVPLLPGAELEKLHQLPRGYTVTQQEVSLHGLCATCRKNQS